MVFWFSLFLSLDTSFRNSPNPNNLFKTTHLESQINRMVILLGNDRDELENDDTMCDNKKFRRTKTNFYIRSKLNFLRFLLENTFFPFLYTPLHSIVRSLAGSSRGTAWLHRKCKENRNQKIYIFSNIFS